TIVSTGEEVSIDIDMLKTKEKRVDVSGWKEAELASDYRSFIRRAERWLKGHEGDKKVDDLLYRMKKAVLEEDDELAEDIEGQLRYYMGE
ncbi:MAG: hypothetical protein K2G51_12530, partial [Lachnospiraceae bacterium]|nr:hypothetical protein [Lachnospiraceae bacterium]